MKVSRHRLDVADREAVAAFPREVLAAHGRADLLFNNAGVAIGGTFEQVAEEDFDWLMEINFWGVVRMTRAFLPLLRAQRPGPDRQRLEHLRDHRSARPDRLLRQQVRGPRLLRNRFAASSRRKGRRSESPSSIPAGSTPRSPRTPGRRAESTISDLEAQKERFEKFLRMPPEKAGEIIVAGVEKERPRVLVGSDARFMALVERLAPVGYWKFLGRALK